MRICHYDMAAKFPSLFGKDNALGTEAFRAEWRDGDPAMVVIHGQRDAERALEKWKGAIGCGRLSMLVVSSEGFGPRTDLPSAACVHWLSWGIPNQGDDGGRPWQERKMRAFLEHVEGLQQNPPDWNLLELPAMPKHLLAGYVLLKAEIEPPDELLAGWQPGAVAELEDLERGEGARQPVFRWEEGPIARALKRSGWLDDA